MKGIKITTVLVLVTLSLISTQILVAHWQQFYPPSCLSRDILIIFVGFGYLAFTDLIFAICMA